MFAKLIAIVLAAGLVAASLLVVRQRRLDLAHDSSRIHRRLQELETVLWELEAGITRGCRPQEVKVAVERLEDSFVPIPDRVAAPRAFDFALAGTGPAEEPRRIGRAASWNAHPRGRTEG